MLYFFAMRKILETARPRDLVFVAVLVVALVISKLYFHRLFNLILLCSVVAVLLYPVYLLVGASVVMHKQKRH